ncbi:MAG: GntR family transcriptional regulator [Peptococcaceae bacterium]|jgi:DNA-binding GntR family transcriptional regulator|nr:GntR family transcriptional regulator [Peptococcaceae bacterium]
MEKIIYQTLKQELFARKIIPTQKLQYQYIADQFNVSRTIVKNVLNVLHQEGLVELIPNKGYYVAELSKKKVEELFAIRVVLERLAIRKAVENFTPTAHDALLVCCTKFSEAVARKATNELFPLDRDFHVQIAQMSNDTTLAAYLTNVQELLFLDFRVEGLASEKNELAEQEHMAMYTAIGQKDTEAALAAYMQHTFLACNLLKLVFSRSESGRSGRADGDARI